MLFRFKVWRCRRRAKIISRHNPDIIQARYGTVIIGTFKHGKEIR